MNCNICKRPFDNGLHRDCGGDCLLCMAELADPDCADEALEKLMESYKTLRAAAQEAANQIRRCDYTPARSTLLTALNNTESL